MRKRWLYGKFLAMALVLAGGGGAFAEGAKTGGGEGEAKTPDAEEKSRRIGKL